MKVLLIEDDPIFQQMYRDEFSNASIDLIVAPEGKSGIIAAVKEKPDFILIDIMLAGMDGVTAFKHLKQMPETRHIPAAFLTVVPEGVPQSLHKDLQFLKGAVGYWGKDKYTPIEVVKLIKGFLPKNPAK